MHMGPGRCPGRSRRCADAFDSGAPAVDADGAVEATIFAARLGAVGGYGVPADVVRADLDAAAAPVPTGKCAP